MYKIGDIISSKYLVKSIPSNQGGMGQVAFVQRTDDGKLFALKYCDDLNTELRNRFRREVRLLHKYQGSEFVVPIIESDLDSDPPMFVMALADMDLSKWIPLLREDLKKQEAVFLRMVDCIEHLHQKNDRHRDIKPHNFLIYGDQIVVSDLGLAKDPSSDTEFTKSIDVRGTFVYSPPQFYMRDGFKHAEFSDDVYMLGKSFYYLLTGLNPYHPMPEEVHSVLFRVIDKCCQPNRSQRYQSCVDLKIAIIGAYDILQSRKSTPVRYEEIKAIIKSSSPVGRILNHAEIVEFFELLKSESTEEQNSFIEDLPTSFVVQITLNKVADESIKTLLDLYWNFLDYAYAQRFYPFGHAEKVADQMSLVARSEADVSLKSEALDIAMDISIAFGRGAAASTCARIIESVSDDALAFSVAEVMKSYDKKFYWESIDLVKCQHFFIVKTVKELMAHKDI